MKSYAVTVPPLSGTVVLAIVMLSPVLIIAATAAVALAVIYALLVLFRIPTVEWTVNLHPRGAEVHVSTVRKEEKNWLQRLEAENARLDKIIGS
jgi:archaellum biogenesis protein FlaJ (TadC family)